MKQIEPNMILKVCGADIKARMSLLLADDNGAGSLIGITSLWLIKDNLEKKTSIITDREGAVGQYPSESIQPDERNGTGIVMPVRLPLDKCGVVDFTLNDDIRISGSFPCRDDGLDVISAEKTRGQAARIYLKGQTVDGKMDEFFTEAPFPTGSGDLNFFPLLRMKVKKLDKISEQLKPLAGALVVNDQRQIIGSVFGRAADHLLVYPLESLLSRYALKLPSQIMIERHNERVACHEEVETYESSEGQIVQMHNQSTLNNSMIAGL